MLRTLLDLGREAAELPLRVSRGAAPAREAQSALRAYPGLTTMLRQAEQRGVLGAERRRMVARLRVH